VKTKKINFQVRSPFVGGEKKKERGEAESGAHEEGVEAEGAPRIRGRKEAGSNPGRPHENGGQGEGVGYFEQERLEEGRAGPKREATV